MQSALQKEEVYSAAANQDLRQLILRIQNDDKECRERIRNVTEVMPKDWLINSEGILRFKGRLYIPAGENLRQTIMRLYH